jgi:hypothetical protein
MNSQHYIGCRVKPLNACSPKSGTPDRGPPQSCVDPGYLHAIGIPFLYCTQWDVPILDSRGEGVHCFDKTRSGK